MKKNQKINIKTIPAYNLNKVLEKDLKGYAEYKKKVKYKVIPFVW